MHVYELRGREAFHRSLCLHDHVETVDRADMRQGCVDWVGEADVFLDFLIPDIITPAISHQDFRKGQALYLIHYC